RGINEFWRPRERTSLCCDPPDAAMRFVAVRMTEARLIMTDDRIVPIAEIKRTVGTELRIDGTKAPASRFDERWQVFQAEACAAVVDLERPHGVVDVAAEDEHALPRVRKMGGANDLAAAGFTAIAIFPNQCGRIVAVTRSQPWDRINRRTVVAGDDN